jgi:dihydroneopterin aldolase
VTQVVRVRGLRAEGRHGARASERRAPQPFVVDLELVVDAEDDDLATTGDYRAVVAAAREVVERESVALIETLAGRIAGAVGALPGVRSCRAIVHKPLAAERLGVADVSAEASAE